MLVFQNGIWGGTPLPEAAQTAYHALKVFWSQSPSTWGFWERWYDSMFEGRPLDWNLQREVALIPDDDWKQGPEHIARLIAEIEARFALKTRIGELEEELARASRDRFGIGGNNPPQAIESSPSISKEFTIIWAPLQDLKLEAESAIPDRSILRRSIKRLAAVLADCARWTGKKVDASMTAAFVAGGTTGGTALIAWATGHGDKVQHVIDAAERWLKALL